MTFQKVSIQSLDELRLLIKEHKYAAFLLLYMIEHSVGGVFEHQEQGVIAENLRTYQPVISKSFAVLKKRGMIIPVVGGYRISPDVLLLDKKGI